MREDFNLFQEPEYRSAPERYSDKEMLYLEVRRREGRVLSDEQVMKLPAIPHSKEWRWRKRSFERIKRYLTATKAKNLSILDLGCGNGWMTNRLAENENWQVTGVDLNREELEQAARLFGRENLRFIYADILQNTLSDDEEVDKFDIIILAASVQYFPALPLLITRLRQLLRKNGEIHLLDSHFYKNEAAREAARQRSQTYYQKMGVPEMAAHYHHHLWPELQALGGVNLNRHYFLRLLQKTGYLAPFPWIRLFK